MELEIVFGGCLGIGRSLFGVWELSVGGWWLDVCGRGVFELRQRGGSRGSGAGLWAGWGEVGGGYGSLD